MLVKKGINPFLLNNFKFSTISIELSITPIHIPLTKNLLHEYKYSGEHSINNFIGRFVLNHSINREEERFVDTAAVIAKCLCNPMLAPSGVSNGSINPHCELFNNRGPTTFDVGSNGKLIFLKCDIKVFQLNRFKS